MSISQKYNTNYPNGIFTVMIIAADTSTHWVQNVQASNGNDDPAGIRWINSDLIGFTYNMKNTKAKTDTT